MTIIDPAEEWHQLSAEEQEQRGAEAKHLENEIKLQLRKTREGLWRSAKALYEFQEISGWTALGMKQREWLAQPDIGITREDFFDYTRMYRVMCVQKGVPFEELIGLHHSKVRLVLSAVEQERVSLSKALEDVREHSASDIRDEYIGSGTRGKRGGPMIGENGGQPDDGAEEPPIIDGRAETVPEPVAPEPEEDVSPELVKAATTVDSWLTVGGRKINAVKQWKVLREKHPVLEAVTQLQKVMDGDEDAPDKQTAKIIWDYVVSALDLRIDSGVD